MTPGGTSYCPPVVILHSQGFLHRQQVMGVTSVFLPVLFLPACILCCPSGILCRPVCILFSSLYGLYPMITKDQYLMILIQGKAAAAGGALSALPCFSCQLNPKQCSARIQQEIKLKFKSTSRCPALPQLALAI